MKTNNSSFSCKYQAICKEEIGKPERVFKCKINDNHERSYDTQKFSAFISFLIRFQNQMKPGYRHQGYLIFSLHQGHEYFSISVFLVLVYIRICLKNKMNTKLI